MKSGSLGEISVLKELVKQGYEVYKPVTDNTKYDMLASKCGKIYRVECKSTNTQPNSVGSYIVQLKRVRSNNTENKIYNFDNTEVDILAVYIEAVDTVILLDASEITVKAELRVKI